MRACGIIVEYNPFHNGHKYHIEQARKQSNADCIIAVMSGNFLQRGEPAIIDKYTRTKAALSGGVDIVVELPFAYAVQSSYYFALGAVHTLATLGISSLCFGSEQGKIEPFIQASNIYQKKITLYNELLKAYLDEGLSYPSAHSKTMQQLLEKDDHLDLTKPNNILGLSYVKRVLQDELSIDLLTIKRIKSDYHERAIQGQIASATSIRQTIIKNNCLTETVKQSLPEVSIDGLNHYLKEATLWHDWEQYFPYLKYRILSMSPKQLTKIHHVTEGLENRVLETAKKSISFNDWMKRLKTKRYTWTRLQRMFVHILTNTTKHEIAKIHRQKQISYIRLLGFNKRGRKYLNQIKKQLPVPLITQVNQRDDLSLRLDERASDIYYSILSPKCQKYFQRKKLQRPIIVD